VKVDSFKLAVQYIADQGWTSSVETRSGASFEAEEVSLILPTQREVAAASRKRLGGKFGWLMAAGNFFDDRRGKKGQSNDSADVAFANSLALADFNQGTRASGQRISQPLIGAGYRLQDC
jgi:hypothetical protein